MEKCEFTPMQEFDFIGTHYILHLSQVTPTEKRKTKVLAQVASFSKAQDKSVRQFMSLIGLLISTFTQVHQMGRLHMRALQWHLSRHWKEGVPYSKRVPVPHSSKCHLRWWGCCYNLDKGTSLHGLKHDVTVFTDASNSGWGAHCQGQEIQGDWTDLELDLHINLLEMRAVLFALRNFGHMLRGKIVLFLCEQLDNRLAPAQGRRGESMGH